MASAKPQTEGVAPQGSVHSVRIASNLDYSADHSPQNQPIARLSRIAVYDDPAFAPRIIEVPYTTPQETIGALAATTHTQVTSQGGSYPYRIIMEACENLIHADFLGVVISISDAGHQVVFSDQGPGISHPAFAQNTGFTNATADMKTTIRGVGAGFTIIREYLESVGGMMRLDSNIGTGTVLTLRVPRAGDGDPGAQTARSIVSPTDPHPPAPSYRAPSFSLNQRQKDVLGVLLKYEEVGPQIVAESLGIGLATAYRDLEALESHGLVARTDQKKRTLTDKGFEYVEYLSGL